MVNSKIVYPYGVAVDYPNRHIFWVDTYLDYIERADFEGRDRRTVLRGSPIQNLYSVTVFQNDVFVSSWRDNSVLRVNKFNSSANTAVVQRNLERPFAVHVFHRQRQPLAQGRLHPCSSDPCAHFCVPTPEEPFYRCACKEGYELQSLSGHDSEVSGNNPKASGHNVNGTCGKIVREKYLLYGQQRPGIVRGIDLREADHDVIVPVVEITRPTAMDYHAGRGFLYLADSHRHKILRQKLDAGTMEEFVTSGLNNVMGMAVDWVGKNLYWTDEGMQAVYVAGLGDGSKKRLLLHENMTHPRSLIVDPGATSHYTKLTILNLDG